MKPLLIAAAIATLGMMPTIVNAQTAAPAAAAPAATPAPAKGFYNTTDTTIGDLLDNPDTKAVLAKYLPQLVNDSNGQIDQARGMTLRGIQQYAPDMLTDKVLNDIDAELAKIPAPKK